MNSPLSPATPAPQRPDSRTTRPGLASSLDDDVAPARKLQARLPQWIGIKGIAAFAMAAAMPLAMALAIGLVGCSEKPQAGPNPGGAGAGNAGDASPPARVRVLTVERRVRPALEEVVGTVQSRVRATVEAKVSGRIQSLPIRLGQMLKAGDLIAELDAREIQARLDQAMAAREQAARDIERVRRLLADKVVAAAEFDEVQARFRIASAGVTEAETMLGYARVTAPFDGVVTRRRAEVGDLASPGKPIADLDDPRQLRLEASVPETAISRLTNGSSLPVRIAGRPEMIPATVTEMAPSADPATRTFLIQADLPAAAGLRPGQFGRALVPVGETATLRVPTSAIVQRGQLELVMVLVDGRAALRLVKTGRQEGDQIDVVAGLEPGETIVRSGADQLLEGQRLEIQP